MNEWNEYYNNMIKSRHTTLIFGANTQWTVARKFTVQLTDGVLYRILSK